MVHYIGHWGHMGSPTQKYITSYTLSPYVQSPMKGSFARAVFSVPKRIAAQAFYVLAPAFIVWEVWTNARDYNAYLYTKAGREELAIVNV